MGETENKNVKLFREILIWPLLIEDGKNREEPSKRLEVWAKALQGSPWEEIDNFFNREPAKKNNGDDTKKQEGTYYSEYVYFHPFVRRFLYGTNNNNHPMRIFRRTDIKNVSINVEYNDPKDLDKKKDLHEEFTVDRIHLYLFDVGVALFVIEISRGESISLEKTQEILDRFRRAYPPYWDNSDHAGHCPTKVQWLPENEKNASDYDNRKVAINQVKENLASPMAAHWQYLIKPFIPWQGGNRVFLELELKQIGDERIPVMAYLAFDDPSELTEGDFMRLGLLDEKESSQTLPYGTKFMADFEKNYCYDRYWDTKRRMQTRYICCGYAFVVIGKDDREDTTSQIFTDENGGMLAHFRHHYLQMGILAHFYHSSLLMFSEKLSNVVDDWNQEDDKLNIFRIQVRSIREELLRFTQRYWFIDISNQVQARELFDLWKKHLGVKEWFEQVEKEASNINEFLNSEQQEKHTKSSVRLAVVATIGLILSIFVNILAIGQEKLMKFLEVWECPLILLIIIIGIILFAIRYSDEIWNWIDPDKK